MEVVGGQDHRVPPTCQLQDEHVRDGLARLIQAGVWLVQQQELGATNEDSGKREALPHALGESLHPFPRPVGELDALERL